MRIRSSVWLALAFMSMLAACGGPSGSRTPTPESSVAPTSDSVPSAGALCPAMTLLSQDGEPVDLTGEWGGGEWFPTPGSGERTFILQRGSCVWAVIMDAEFRADPRPQASQLAMYSGTLREDFTLTGTLVVMVRWNDPFTYGNQAPGPYPMDWRLEYDDAGQIRLVEDRVPGVEGPRCPNPVMWCPDPTVLQPVAPLTEPAS